MKKEYKKPQLLVENFMVSDFIASCNDVLTFANNSQCQGNSNVSDGLQQALDGLIYQGYFTDDTLGCRDIMSPDDFFASFDGEICYHNSSNGYQVFSS